MNILFLNILNILFSLTAIASLKICDFEDCGDKHDYSSSDELLKDKIFLKETTKSFDLLNCFCLLCASFLSPAFHLLWFKNCVVVLFSYMHLVCFSPLLMHFHFNCFCLLNCHPVLVFILCHDLSAVLGVSHAISLSYTSSLLCMYSANFILAVQPV